MSDQLVNAVVHTTVGVTTLNQTGEEVNIQPSILIKDFQGKVFSIPAQHPAEGPSDEPCVNNAVAKIEMADVLTAIVVGDLNKPRTMLEGNRHSQEISEEDVTPTFITRDQKKIMLEVLNQWTKTENSKEESVFQKAVSEVITSQKQEVLRSDLTDINNQQVYEASFAESGSVTKQSNLCREQQENYILSQTENSHEEQRRPEHNAMLASFHDPVLANKTKHVLSHGTVQKEQAHPIFKSEDRKATSFFETDDVLNIFNSNESKDHSLSLQQTNTAIVTVQEKPNSDLKNVDSLETCANILQANNTENVSSLPKTTKKSNVEDKENAQEQQLLENPTNSTTDKVVLRRKSKQSDNKTETMQSTRNSIPSSMSSKRPKSMVDNFTANTTSSKISDIRKSFTLENKSLPALRPLSGMRPFSMSTTDLSRLSSVTHSRPAGSTFASRAKQIEYPKTRTNDGSAFQIDVLKGITGIGIKVKVTSQGHVQITEIQRGGPVDKTGQVRVGDYLLFVNSTELNGQTEARVQQVLRLLPRGLIKLVISRAAPASDLSSESNQQFQDRRSLVGQVSQSSSENQQALRSASKSPSHNTAVPKSLPGNRQTKDAFYIQPSILPIVFTDNILMETPTIEKEETNTTSGPKTVNQQQPILSINKAEKLKNVSRHENVFSTTPTSIEDSSTKKRSDFTRSVIKSNEESPVEKRPANQAFCTRSELSQDYVDSAKDFDAPADLRLMSRDLEKDFADTLSSNKIMSITNSKVTKTVSDFLEKSTTYSSPTNNSTIDTTKIIETNISVIEKIKPDSSFSENVASHKEALAQATSDEVLSLSSPSSQVSDKKEYESIGSRMRKSLTSGWLAEEVVFEELKTPQKKNPPTVAPKPRLHSAPSIGSDDSGAGNPYIPSKPQTKRGTRFERLQVITADTKPTSAITTTTASEKSGFVSSAAKRFNANSTKDDVYLQKPAATKLTSANATTNYDKSNANSTPLRPIKERWTYGETYSPPNAFSQSKALNSFSRSTSVSSMVARPKSGASVEPSRRYSTSANKAEVVLASPSLNLALSPRKTAFDYSITHPVKIPAESNFEYTAVKSASNNRQTTGPHNTNKTGRYNLYKSASVASLDTKSLSQEQEFLAYRGINYKAGERFRKSSYSPESSQTNKVLETMKKFDELLMDPPYERTKTDKQDLLLWDSLECSSRTSSQSLSYVPTNSKEPLARSRAQLSSISKEIENEQINNKCDINTKDKGDLINKADVKETEKYLTKNKQESLTNLSLFYESQIVDDVFLRDKNGDSKASSHTNEHSPKILHGKPDMISYIKHSPICEQENKNQIIEEFNSLLETPSKNTRPVLENFEKSLQILSGTTEHTKVTADIRYTNYHNQQSNNNYLKNHNTELITKNVVENVKTQTSGEKQQLQGTDFQYQNLHRHESSTSDDEMINTESSQTTSLVITDDGPPPLPCAPPPILNDTTVPRLNLSEPNELLIDSAIPSVNSHDEQGHKTSGTLLSQSTSSSTVEMEAKITFGDQMANGRSDNKEDQRSKSDTEPLNSSFQDRDNARLHSPSSVDMLSEDSGMPADEDQEVATDDAISPPGELAESTFGLDSLKNMLLPSEIKAAFMSSGTEYRQMLLDTEIASKMISTTEAGKLNTENERKRTASKEGLMGGLDAKTLGWKTENKQMVSENLDEQQNTPDTVSELLLPETVSGFSPSFSADCPNKSKEAMANVTSPHGDGIEKYIENTSESLPPPLLPSSAPPNIANTSSYTEDLFGVLQSSTVHTTAQKPGSETFSPEIDLLGDLVNNDKEKIKQESVNEKRSETMEDNMTKQGFNIVGDNFKERHVFNETKTEVSQESTPPKITSKRKWLLRTNKCKSPVLFGESKASVIADYTEKHLLKALPYINLVDFIGRANAVLDAVPASDTLLLVIVHLHRDGHIVPIGIDLKHEGGTLFRVSDIKMSSPAWEEGSAKVGDWLVAVDSLWCDQANLMRFLSRLGRPKHDSVLLLGRDESLAAELEPVKQRPVPRPRSSNKQRNIDEVDRATELQKDILISTKETILAKEQNPLDSRPEKNVQLLPQNREQISSVIGLETSDESTCIKEHIFSVTEQISSHQEVASAQVLLHPGQVSSLPEQTPALQKQTLLLQKRAPPLLEQAPLLPEQAPPLLEQAPPLPVQAPLHPEQAPPLPEQAPPLQAQLHPLTAQTQITRQMLSLQEQEPLLSEKISSLPEKKPFSQQAPQNSNQKREPVSIKQKQILAGPITQDISLSYSVDKVLKQESDIRSSLFEPFLPSQNATKVLKAERSQSSISSNENNSLHTTDSVKERVFSRDRSEAKPDTGQNRFMPSNVVLRVSSHPQSPPLSVTKVEDHHAAVSNTVTCSTTSSVDLGPGIHKIVLIKGATGVGFCLEGGIGSPKGDLPITVKRIFKGGPAEKYGLLQVKDEILEVNGLNFSTMGHYEAWNLLKFLNDGEVHITICRQ